MAKISQPPTPYAAINVLLYRLLTEVQAMLGTHFFGMYLYGSLATGDFDERSSDVDFVVVTRGEIGEDVIPKLRAVHEGLWQNGGKWAAKLEGAYISLAGLRRYSADDIARPFVNEGEFKVEQFGSDWIIQRYILREYGAVVAGPPLKEWIDPVSPDEIRGAVAGVLLGWWSNWIVAHPQELERPEYQPYVVLTMCRAQYAFVQGEIVSKPVAARWAIEALDVKWRGLIERAMTHEADLSADALERTRAMVRETIEMARAGEVE